MKKEENRAKAKNDEFKEAKSSFLYEITMIEVGDNSVEPGHSYKECMYERVIRHIKDGCSDVAKACKRYIECAANYDKLKDAENEIKRLLHVAERDDIGSKNINPKEDAASIMEMYTPAQLHKSDEVKDKLEKILGKEMINIFEQIESAKSEEEALQIIKETNAKDMTINLKDLIMAIYSTEAKDSGNQHQEKNTGSQTQTKSTISKQAPAPSQVGNPTDMVDAAEYLANTPLGQKLQLFTHIPEVAPAQ